MNTVKLIPLPLSIETIMLAKQGIRRIKNKWTQYKLFVYLDRLAFIEYTWFIYAMNIILKHLKEEWYKYLRLFYLFPQGKFTNNEKIYNLLDANVTGYISGVQID